MKALSVLGVAGDAALGEWWERGELATHLRRRLSLSEAESVGPVVDVRGTSDAQRRMEAMWPYLPTPGVRAFALQEAGK